MDSTNFVRVQLPDVIQTQRNIQRYLKNGNELKNLWYVRNGAEWYKLMLKRKYLKYINIL